MRNLESWILSYLLNALWQVPLLAGVGWLAARTLRRLGPAAEHRAWVTILMLQGAVPVLSTFSWSWLRSLWFWHASVAPAGAHVAVEFGAGQTVGGVGVPAWVPGVVGAAYVAVTAYFLALFAMRCVLLARMRRVATPLELTGDAAACWLRAERHFGLRDVSLATSADLAVPVTLGVRRSVVLLPASMAHTFTVADLRTILDHEFAHIRRHDFALNLAYELLSLPIRFHPLLYITRERITETREMICDQLAAESAGPLEYGRSLLRLASLLVMGPPVRTPYAIGIFDAGTLERRLMRLKENRKTTTALWRASLIAGCVLFVAGACASALALHMNVDAAAVATPANSTDSNNPQSVPAGKMAGNLLKKVTPKYPEDAKKAGIQGTVKLDAIIDKEGHVDHLTVVSGPEVLRQSALDAVRQWEYKPYLLNGEPVSVKTTINIIYSLAKKPSKDAPPPQPPPSN